MPLNCTIPVATEQVGCVIELIIGADGVTGCVLMTTLPDAGEVQPAEFVTVNVYVPAVIPDMILLVPVPAPAPGLMVQFPVGKSFKVTLPVETVQVAWIIVPTVGADGVAGWAFTTIFTDAVEVHPAAFVTV